MTEEKKSFHISSDKSDGRAKNEQFVARQALERKGAK